MKTHSKAIGAVLFVLASSQLFAQAPAPNPALATPPKLDKVEKPEKADEAPASAMAIGKEKKKNATVDRREGGKVTEVDVTSGGSHYKLKPNPEVGNAPAGSVQGTVNRPAQWSVLEFGGPKKEAKEEKDVPQTLQPYVPASPPPPPALPDVKSDSTSASNPSKKKSP